MTPTGRRPTRPSRITRLNVFLCPSDTPPSFLAANATAPLTTYTAPGNNYFAFWARRSSSRASRTAARPTACSSTWGPWATAGSASATSGTGRPIRSPSASGSIGTGNYNHVSIPPGLVFDRELYPSGTTRNNGTLNLPNPTLWPAFPAWLNQCKAALQSVRPDESHQYARQTWAFGLPCRYDGQRPAAAEPAVSQLQHRYGLRQRPGEPWDVWR